MQTFKILPVSLFVLALFACHTTQKTVKTIGDDGILEITFLQMNDVYEISPGASDNLGGLARVATIRKQLLAKNPNTFTLLAGDFISPSVIGTLKYDGKRIRGKQMVETLDTLGLDWVVFGNHEFDYDDPADLQARLDESTFTWMGANARFKGKTWTQQFFKNRDGKTELCPDNQVIAIKDADGTTMNLGMFGVLINTGRKPYVEYTDWAEAAQKNYTEVAAKSDVCIAITHLNIVDDKKLAVMLPKMPLIMGGHDHENQIYKIGTGTVAKADANAKTVYIHTLRYDKAKNTCTVKSELRKVDATIPDDPATAKVIAKWEKIKNESLASSGFDATKTVTTLTAPLDCRETMLRYQQMAAGTQLNNAMLAVARTKPDAAFFNSGSFRVDDILRGTLTELDIVRMLPFGGSVVEVEMRGALLRRTLDAGYNNKGNGGYLQWQNIRREEPSGTWMVGNTALDDQKVYRLILPEFLLTGSEQNMDFLKTAATTDGKGTTNPDVLSLQKPDPKDKSDLRNDIRQALIGYWRK